MALQTGSRLGPYEILGAIGAGGMGEVYRARDTKLNREVVIKILPDSFAHDAERVARFTREAQTLAALNHPHIAQIHGLEEAHEHGIIHRDLKPANIKVKDDGTVKVLDFGLAKALDPAGGAASVGAIGDSPTITSPAAMTHQGVILGTAAYMPPEQAKGRAVDKRADIWAFGCVLFEMLTAKRAFDGEDVFDTLTAVAKSEPDWNALPSDVPEPIRTLVKRCLEKDRRTHFRHRRRAVRAGEGRDDAWVERRGRFNPKDCTDRPHGLAARGAIHRDRRGVGGGRRRGRLGSHARGTSPAIAADALCHRPASRAEALFGWGG